MADELSFRVRKLDVVCSHVSDALKIVDDLLELRECSDQVRLLFSWPLWCQGDEGDRLRGLRTGCQIRPGRAFGLSQGLAEVSRFRAAQEGLPAGTDDATLRTLMEAERQLSAIVRRQFEAAMAAKDAASVSRFAKLFHPLGLASEGVQKYVEFIKRSLAEKASVEFKRQRGGPKTVLGSPLRP